MVHPQLSKSPKPSDNTSLDTDDFRQDNECLPAENVAVIDELMSEEKLENLRAMVSGNVRKKLYFNPAYFEPHLLAVSLSTKRETWTRSYLLFHPPGTPASGH